MNVSRRSFVVGLAGMVAAPAIVRASSLMPVKSVEAVPLAVTRGANGLIPMTDFEAHRRALMKEFHVLAEELINPPLFGSAQEIIMRGKEARFELLGQLLVNTSRPANQIGRALGPLQPYRYL